MTIFRKTLSSVAAAALIWSLASAEKAEAAAIDIMVVVDESGSMSGEHAWLDGMISSLDSALNALGITGNYGLVGFGSASVAPRTLTDFSTLSAFTAATDNLLLNGATEDGYAGMDYGFNNLTFGGNGATATNVILVTDEDRDNTNGALTLASMAAQLSTNNALLNAVVNNPYTSDNNGSSTVLGVDADGNAYVADGAGGFTTDSGGLIGNGAGATETDYAGLAVNNGGATWNLDLLRAGGLTADSFTAAFVNIKVQEIQAQVPEPGMILVTGLGLVVMAGLRRRKAVSPLAG